MHAKDKDRNKIYEVSSSNGPVDHSINQETPEMKGNFGILGGSFHGPSDHDSKGNVEKIGKENSSHQEISHTMILTHLLV